MIPKQFIKTKELYEEYKEDYKIASPAMQAVCEDLKNNQTGNYWHYDLGETFKSEYSYHIKEDLYFTGCPYFKYVSVYEERKQNFIDESKDALEIDFIIKELNEISQIGFEFCPEKLKVNIQHSINRQKEFLLERALHTKNIIEHSKDRWGTLNYTYKKDLSSIPQESYTDLSESGIKEKIIYLQSLGVLDYLKSLAKNGYSINSLASLLSGIIGEKPGTIQSYINPINNSTVDQKNNPMTNSKNVSKIKQTLIELGFSPPK